jgi:hypothetical protein
MVPTQLSHDRLHALMTHDGIDRMTMLPKALSSPLQILFLGRTGVVDGTGPSSQGSMAANSSQPTVDT